jgi:hypothetical protein
MRHSVTTQAVRGLAGLLLASVVVGAPRLAAAADGPAAGPTVAKDSVRVQATQIDGVWKAGKRGSGSSWLPRIEFRLNGPLPSGSAVSVEFTLPGNKPWVKYACPDAVSQVKASSWWKMACGALLSDRSAAVKESQASTATGQIGFSIRVANALAGTKAVLFSGKARVDALATRPRSGTPNDYFVDDDWRLPIGYVGFERGASKHGAGQTVKENDSDTLLSATEFRGRVGDVKAHLFYQGKELAQDWCVKGESSERNPTLHVWLEVECNFRGVYRDEPPPGQGEDPRHALTKNPGDYEIRILDADHLVRSVRFTIAPDGTFASRVAAANKLGSNRVVVPVEVIGDQGPWDTAAWKTGAFYGNPLKGFAARP